MQGGVVEEASECICGGVRLCLKFHNLTEKIWKSPWQLLTWSNVSSISSTGAGNSFSSFEDQNIFALGTVLDELPSC
jgi:hypothetical protein